MDYFLPVAQTVNEVLSATIAANAVEKDIWMARQVTLEEDGNHGARDQDSGLDTQIFAELDQLWTNTEEIPNNGIDDDDNGYVDDAHGIAYGIPAKWPTCCIRLGTLRGRAGTTANG